MIPRALVLSLLACAGTALADSVVVFNEINYNPPSGGEWIELRNQLAVDVDMSGWSLAAGVAYTFPDGTIIPADGVLVVRDATAVIAGALGPFTGRLDNGGETLELRNNSGRVMDRLNYKPDGDWPVAADGTGPTLARRGPNLATDDPASWIASMQAGGTPGAENFPTTLPPTTAPLLAFDGTWKSWTSGTDPGGAWKSAAFDDSSWSEGAGVFQLGALALPSPLSAGTSLPAGPVTYFFRRTFTFTGQVPHTTLRLRLLADDGAAVHLNGTELLRVNLPAGATVATPAAQPRRGEPRVQEFSVPGNALVVGSNILAVEVHQAATLPAYPAAVLGSGPVAYWRLGESAAPVSDLADLTSAPEFGPQEGTFAGFSPANLAQAGPRPVDLVGGQPLTGFDAGNTAPGFQGNNDGGNDVVLFPDAAGSMNFGPAKKFTFEAWVKAPASGHDEGGPVLAKGYGGGGEQFACDFVGGKYRFYVWDGGSPNTPVVAQSAVAPNNTWQHVVGVYDQTQSLMRLYVNGAQAASATPRPTLVSTTHEVSIGSRKTSSGSPYDLNMVGVVDEVSLYARALTAADVTAHYQAAFAVSSAAVDTSDAAFALAVDAIETLPAAVRVPLVFNEVPGASDIPAWLEIANAGTQAQSLTGASVAHVSAGVRVDVPLPPGSLSAGAFTVLDAAALGRPLLGGDKLVLFSAEGVPLDGVVVKNTARARFPDGTGPWRRPTALTSGAPNVVFIHRDVVINEVMYQPPSPPLPASAVPSQWIELHNRSAGLADLSGWKLRGGISYDFPVDTLMAPGGFLVVAAAPASLPGTGAFGPWSGKLSRSHDRVILEDSAGNPADEIAYFAGGHWPEYADGGGSSLERIDPRADGTHPQSWAASDETGAAAWQTFTWRGPANPGIAGEPTQWNEIDLGLVDGAGECLLDDVRVTDLTTSQNLIQNGDFSAGMTKWRATGTHRFTRVEAETGQPGNQVLHVVATGPAEYQGNQIESTFVGATALVTGREYEISLRARWLAGAGKLNARLYFNRIARTLDLAVAPRGGTPGRANSRTVANAGPSVSALAHEPAVPVAAQPISVTATVADPDGVGSVVLKYAVNGGAWQTLSMVKTGNRVSATIPGQAAAALVQFYVEAADSLGAVSQFPPGGPESRAMCPVADGGAAAGPAHKFRLVMTTADANFMHATLNVLSNASLRGTVIADERDIYYDVGIRLKGSFVGRNVPRVGFNVRFQPDQPFRGVHEKVAIDRSQHVAIAQGEIVAKHIASRVGGIPNMYDDLARFVHVLGSYNSSCQVRLTGFEDEYLATQYPSGDEGRMYELESLRYSSSTSDGSVDGIKLTGAGYANPEVQDRGNDKEAYRWNWLLSNHRADDDFAPAMRTAKLFSMTGTTFDTESKARLDVDQWLRAMAFQTLVGPADSIYTGGNVHNIRFYARPHDGRMLYMPWDWDSVWQRGTSDSLIGGGNVARVVTVTAHNQRQYYHHVHDIVTKAFNSAYITRWTQHYGAVAAEDYSGIASYVAARSNFALSQLPTATAWAAVAGTPDGNGAVTLTGTANIRAASIEVNGVVYAPTWTSTTAWRITVPLALGGNTLVIRALDRSGVALSGAETTLGVTNPNTPAWAAVRISEWMAENDSTIFDPADGKSEDWLELQNPLPLPLDVSNWSLSDDPAVPRMSVLPAGSILPAGGYLLLWADNEPAQGITHLGFKLSNAGETIGLYAPDGRLMDVVTFGPQRADRSEGRYGASATPVALTLPTPGAANVLLGVTAAGLSGGGMSLEFSTTPGRRYRVDHSPDLTTWLPLSTEQIAPGDTLQVTDPTPPALRFYRAVIVP